MTASYPAGNTVNLLLAGLRDAAGPNGRIGWQHRSARAKIKKQEACRASWFLGVTGPSEVLLPRSSPA